MEVHDLISKEVWEKAKRAFENHEYFVTYNNTLLFVHESDIHFFSNMEDAVDFASNNVSEFDHWDVEKIYSLDEFKIKVESVMPGLTYTPPVAMPVINEPAPIYLTKRIIMEPENLEYLKNQLKFLGFDEGLYVQLEKKMKEGKPEFTLDASHEFGSSKMSAVINFKLGEREGKPYYYCNSYVSTLQKEEQKLSQFIYVNGRGQSVTFKESCNLLNGRSVFKEITPKEGAAYKAWLKIDHEKMDERTGYPKLRSFGTNYGFDLAEAVGRMPFKEMNYADQVKTVMKSLEKGNLRLVTLVGNQGKEQPVLLEANPQFKTMNMYDKDMNKMYYPSQKVAVKYGKAPADEKKKEAGQVAEKQEKYSKRDLLAKKGPSNGLIPKKGAKKTKGNRLV